MPPKKEKDASALIQATLSLPHDEQVNLLSQALLREYMHRKQYLTTLKKFDEENPRDEKTIGSRVVMSELMYISPEVAAGMKQDGIETIMEMLCGLRVSKKASFQQKWEALHQKFASEAASVSGASVLSAEAPPLDPAVAEELRTLEDEIKKAKKRVKKLKKEKEEAKAAAKAEKKEKKVKKTAEEDAKSSKAPKSGKEKKDGLLSIDELLEQDDMAKIRKRQEEQEQKKAEKKRALDAATVPAVESQKTSVSASSRNSDESSSESSSSDGSESDNSDDDDYASALRKIRDEEQRALASRQKQAKGWEGPLDVDDTPPIDAAHRRDSASPNRPEPSSSSQQHQVGPVVGPLDATATREALVGNDRRIPSSFWNQGFHLSRDVPYGYVQNEGGCCGVLAVIQALVVADIFGNRRLLTDDVFRGALVGAVRSVLCAASPSGLNGVVVVFPTVAAPGASNAHHHHHHGHTPVDESRTVKDQLTFLSKLSKRSDFSSTAQLDAFLATEVLKSWSEPRGQGLLSLMVSLVLTRGVANIRADMDVESPLIVEHGYCSQELVNLLLCGRASSNVHDGDVQHGELLLKGIKAPSRSLPIGFLSYMEHRQLLNVGSLLKQPHHPVWVVNHESHYTVLFMKEDARKRVEAAKQRGFSPSESFDVYFWDQLGGFDEEIRLTITLEKTPVPPVGKDTLVPFLNDIIRTMPEWKTARVAWNGTDPLL